MLILRWCDGSYFGKRDGFAHYLSLPSQYLTSTCITSLEEQPMREPHHTTHSSLVRGQRRTNLRGMLRLCESHHAADALPASAATRHEVSTWPRHIGDAPPRRPSSTFVADGITSSGECISMDLCQLHRSAELLTAYVQTLCDASTHLRSLGRLTTIVGDSGTLRYMAMLHWRYQERNRHTASSTTSTFVPARCCCAVPWDMWRSFCAYLCRFQTECARQDVVQQPIAPAMSDALASVIVDATHSVPVGGDSPAVVSEPSNATAATATPIDAFCQSLDSCMAQRVRGMYARLQRSKAHIKKAADLMQWVRLASVSCSRAGCAATTIHCLSRQLDQLSCSMWWTLQNARVILDDSLVF